MGNIHRAVVFSIDYAERAGATYVAVDQVGTGDRARRLLRIDTISEFTNDEIDQAAGLADQLVRRWMTKLGTGRPAMF